MYNQKQLVSLTLHIFFISAVSTDSGSGGTWTWLAGGVASNPVFGQQGFSSPSNIIGSMYGPGHTFLESSKTLYLYGGLSYTNEPYGALWKFDGNWTYLSGDLGIGFTGRQNLSGVFAPDVLPPSLDGPSVFIDQVSNMLYVMFGGTRSNTFSNFMWKYEMTLGQWAYIRGVTGTRADTSFGSFGVFSPNYIPGCRKYATSFYVQSDRMFYLFSGVVSIDSLINTMRYGDFWRFNSSNEQWALIRGDPTTTSAFPGYYNDYGLFDPQNFPAPRQFGVAVYSPKRRMAYIFGGRGRFGFGGPLSPLGDLNAYNLNTGMFALLSGEIMDQAAGSFGSMGVEASSNMMPGTNLPSIVLDDERSAIYFFGGLINSVGGVAYSNALWKYNITTNRHTWLSGSQLGNQAGSPGIMGVERRSNMPSCRGAPILFLDNANGLLYAIAGQGLSFGNIPTQLSEVWRYRFVGANDSLITTSTSTTTSTTLSPTSTEVRTTSSSLTTKSSTTTRRTSVVPPSIIVSRRPTTDKESASSSFNPIILAPISLGTLLVLALIGLAVSMYTKKRNHTTNSKGETLTFNQTNMSNMPFNNITMSSTGQMSYPQFAIMPQFMLQPGESPNMRGTSA